MSRYFSTALGFMLWMFIIPEFSKAEDTCSQVAKRLCQDSEHFEEMEIARQCIRELSDFLQIKPENGKDIKFVELDSFKAFDGDKRSSPKISFPKSRNQFSCETLAVLAHEMAHLRQYQDFGSPQKAREWYVEPISEAPNSNDARDMWLELEADFLAGCILASIYPSVGPGAFSKAYDLASSFNRDLDSFHGSPTQRNNAFRFGYFGFRDDCVQHLKENSIHDFFRDEIIPRLTTVLSDPQSVLEKIDTSWVTYKKAPDDAFISKFSANGILARCKDIHEIILLLQSEHPITMQVCREGYPDFGASNAEEEKIQRYFLPPEIGCFLDTNSTTLPPAIRGFSCYLDTRDQKNWIRRIICLREVDPSDAMSFLRNYGDYRSSINEYSQSAAMCPYSNGDLSEGGLIRDEAVMDLFSLRLMAFTSGVEKDAPTIQRASHGLSIGGIKVPTWSNSANEVAATFDSRSLKFYETFDIKVYKKGVEPVLDTLDY